MDIAKFIEPQILNNTEFSKKLIDTSLNTVDYVYLPSVLDVKSHKGKQRICYPTDYAILNNCDTSFDEYLQTCDYKLREQNGDNNIFIVDMNGCLYERRVGEEKQGIRPALSLNFNILSQLQVNIGKDRRGRKFPAIMFGEFPKTYVGERHNRQLEKMFNEGRLVKTGKKYIGHLNNENEIVYNDEYELEGEKFVRTLAKFAYSHCRLKDKTQAYEIDKYAWVRVEPITWEITNWKDLPKSINPKGKTQAQTIEVISQEAIIGGLPFYINDHDKNKAMWQNSTIRGYLNGINVNNIQENGNPDFGAPHGGDFSSGGFLKEAFDFDIQKVNSSQTSFAGENVERNKEEGFIDEIFSKAQKSVEEEMER